MTTNLEALRMEHLEPVSSDDVLEAAKAAVGAETPGVPAAPAKDPRDEEVWTFQFTWTDSRGKKYDDAFTNKILGFDELQLTAVIKSRYLGGQPLHSFSDEMLQLTGAVAHMQLSLVKRPDWAKDLRKIKDAALLMELWGKVDSHEVRYFRLGEDQAANPHGA